MKKRVKTKQLGRDQQARKALFKGLIASLIKEEEIQTTSAKAKAVRSMFEKLVTKARVGSLHARRQIQSFIQDKSLVKKLVDDIAPRFKNVPGGYTKLTIVGNRKGDNAPMVKLSFPKQSTQSSKQDKQDKPSQSSAKKSKKLSTASSAPTQAPKRLAPTQTSAPSGHSSSRTSVRQGER